MTGPRYQVEAVSAIEADAQLGYWGPFRRDVVLKLEQTPGGEWLKFTFETSDQAVRARSALTSWTHARGWAGLVMTRLDQGVLYVGRGKRYEEHTGTTASQPKGKTASRRKS